MAKDAHFLKFWLDDYIENTSGSLEHEAHTSGRRPASRTVWLRRMEQAAEDALVLHLGGDDVNLTWTRRELGKGLLRTAGLLLANGSRAHWVDADKASESIERAAVAAAFYPSLYYSFIPDGYRSRLILPPVGGPYVG